MYYREKYTKTFRSYLIQTSAFAAFMIAGIPTTLVPGILFGACDPTIQLVSFLYAVLGAAISCVEWIPQIIKTVKSK